MTRRPWGSGTIEPRGKDKWLIRWSQGTDPFTGKQSRKAETLHGVTKAEAQRILNQRQAARRLTTRVTLGELLDVTLPELRVEPATRERYEHALKLIPAGARVWPVADITVPAAGDLFNQLAERHGPASVRKCHTAILACWKQAYRNGWVGKDDNPFAGIRLPKVKRSAGKRLTDVQVAALIAVAEPGAEHCWVMLHVETGARPGEIRQLRWSQIDLEHAVVNLVDEKHKGAVRSVSITQHLVDDLAAWHANQRTSMPTIADPYLFSTAPNASTPWRREYVRDRWHALAKRAGLPSSGDNGYRLYDLRHTNNSAMAEAGIPDHVRARRLGNSSRVNTDIYTHSSEHEDRAAADYIGQRFT